MEIKPRCSCAEVVGEDPECALHGLTIARIADWSDLDCDLQPEWESWTIRRVARVTRDRLEAIARMIETARENGNFDSHTEAAEEMVAVALNGVCRDRRLAIANDPPQQR